MKHIIIGSDHAGFELKSFIKDYLQSNGYNVDDIGTFSKESCDYPDIAKTLSQKIKENPNSFGVLICGTGIGMSISVNRFNFIRGALLYNKEVAKLISNDNVVWEISA